MTVHAEDLPLAVRRRLGLVGARPGRAPEAAEQGSDAAGARPGRAGPGPDALSIPCPGRCVSCGERFPNALRWQQHADETGCSIWSIDLHGSEIS